jgi:hypothetical protein
VGLEVTVIGLQLTQTCVQQPPLGLKMCCCSKVVVIQRLILKITINIEKLGIVPAVVAGGGCGIGRSFENCSFENSS